jgi:hypothetical protein
MLTGKLNPLWFFLFAWWSSGCATTYPVVDTPYTRRGEEITELRYSAAVDATAERLSIQLHQDVCEAHWMDHPVTTTRIYKKATFLAGPGLLLGGLGAGVLGGALFVDANNEPKTCPEGDDECVTKDETRGMAVVASGLGAAGVIVGAYNTFKAPRLIEARETVGVGVPDSAPCPTQQQSVPVVLAHGDIELVRGQTDGQGRISWNVPEAVMATWPPQLAIVVPNAPPVSIDVSYAVVQAQMGVLRKLFAEYERERQRRAEQRARLEAERAQRVEPEEPSFELDPLPASSDFEVFRRWVNRQRVRAAGFLRQHQEECQFVLGKGVDWGVQAVFAEELLAERLLEKAFGRKVEKWVSEALVWGLKLFFKAEYDQLLEIANRAKAGVSGFACEELTALIDPRPVAAQ